MYDLINRIISHNWIMQGANEQQYIYMIVGALIIILTVCSIDIIYRFFTSLFRLRR